MHQGAFERHSIAPRKISKTLFALVLVGCFFLPFITVFCENRSIEQFFGTELVTGTTVTTPSVANQSEQLL